MANIISHTLTFVVTLLVTQLTSLSVAAAPPVDKAAPENRGATDEKTASSDNASPQNARRLSPLLEKTLWAFPPDTETIVVGQTMEIVNSEKSVKRSVRANFASAVPTFAMGQLVSIDKGRFYDLLDGQKVELAVLGGRKFESVSVFGALRYHGCAIIKFAKDLGPVGDKLMAAARTDAKKVEMIAGREAFVFETPVPHEPYIKVEDWEAGYILQLAPDVLLVGTNARYIREVLARWGQTHATRAMPETLPEWRYVDTAAPLWMVRRLAPAVADKKAVATGMALHLMPAKQDVIEFFYIPREGKDCEAYARSRWPKEVELSPTIRKLESGATRVTQHLADLEDAKLMWMALLLNSSLGERFVVDE